MSLVVPHPLLQTEAQRFEDWHRRKLSVKPGMTCLWQINGRSHVTDFDLSARGLSACGTHRQAQAGEWVRMALEYIDTWSLWLDIKILLKTVPAVVSGRGAY